MLASFLILASAITCVTSQYTPAALADQITKLPGTDLLSITFNQFSGYLPIAGAAGNSKNIHYWMVESTNKPATDPVTFWTNGGPGCSGLIGFFTEQGPFRPNADGSVSFNDYAWNKVSNMVFIESPCGVGFSYSNTKADLKTGDAQTALDNYNLIQAFMQRFPQLSTNPLYISSESYGGHYMPTLAKQIVDSNKAAVGPILNFKGFAVGNPYTNVYSGTPAMIDTYWGHQIIAKSQYDNYVSACTASSSSLRCLQAQVAINNAIGNLNAYALDYPVCLSSSKESRFGRAQRMWFLNHQLASMGIGASDKQRLGLPVSDSYQPCEDNWATTYLNRADVKAAIHVQGSITWGECSNTVQYNSSDGQVSTAPIYQYLINGGFGLNILVYSGDDDSVCATIGTQNWIWDLGYTASNLWQTYYVNGQTAGFLTQWKNTKLGFLTVHGAGHEVPTYVPEVALDLFTKYLAGTFTNV